MKFIFIIFIFLYSNNLFSCEPDQIFIREEHIEAYTKENGTKVSSHTRSEHCRTIKPNNYFEDITRQKFKNINTKLKKWSKKEKLILNNLLKSIPSWLKKYVINELLRGDKMNGSPLNPASSIAKTRTIIFYDTFFNSNDQQSILTHEVSHFAFWDLDQKELMSFIESSGWMIGEGSTPEPPIKLLLPDSSDSISEDFANHVELYYSNPTKLKNHNYKSYQVIKSIIDSREK